MLKKYIAEFDVYGTLLDGDFLLLASRHSIQGSQKYFMFVFIALVYRFSVKAFTVTKIYMG